MKNLSSHLSPYRWNILLAVLAMGISAGSDLGLPLLLAQIVNVGLYQDDLAVVLRLGGWMLALALLGGGFALLNSYLSAQISANVGRTLRAEIFDKVESFSPAESGMFGTASLITRSTNDVVQIQNYLLALLRVVVRAPILDWCFPSEPAPPFLWFFVFHFLCLLFPFRLWRKKGCRFPLRCRSGSTASPSLCGKS